MLTRYQSTFYDQYQCSGVYKQKNKGTKVILNVEFWILNVDQGTRELFTNS